MNSNFQHLSQNLIWISKNDKLPQRCCTCGMFTDRTVGATHVTIQQTTVQASGAGSLLVGCLLQFLLGPIGWILALLFHGDDETKTKTKTSKKKHKIRIPQCMLCSGHRKVEPVDVAPGGQRYAFDVHPEFIRQFEIENAGKQ